MKYPLLCLPLACPAETPADLPGDPSRHHHPSPLHRHHDFFSGENQSGVALSSSAAFESRYVLEGRDILDGAPFLSATIEASWNDWLLTLWYGGSPSNSYDELHLAIERGFRMGPIEAHFGYTHLRFPHDRTHDHEVFAGILAPDLPLGLELGIDGTYAFGADGTFWEISLARTFKVHELVSLQPAITAGFNGGYVPSGHRGANHLALSLTATIGLSERVELSSYLAYNFAIGSRPLTSPDDGLLRDFAYAGIGLTLSL